MSQQLKNTVAFDIIRYSNCWEDANVLLEGLKPVPGDKILSIGSAGDNSFSLLINEPELVVAVDINKIQLNLIELKKISIQLLAYDEVLALLGFTESKRRIQTFNSIADNLSEDARKYWLNNLSKIERGIIHEGKFEKYFQLFSSKILPFIHNKNTVESLLGNKSAEEQQLFFAKHWNTWRWRLLFKLFFSKYVMGKLGRDPEFLKEVEVPVSSFILNKAAIHLQSKLAQQNVILRYALTGSFGSLLPHYLEPVNFAKIKSNMHKLHLFEGYAEDTFAQYGSFNLFNLSNIFEYMNKEQFVDVASSIVKHTLPGAKMAYWNLMVPRKISAVLPNEVQTLQELSSELSKIDKGFFYNAFIVDTKK